MNILLYSPVFFPERSGVASVNMTLAMNLCKSHSVTILTPCRGDGRDGEFPFNIVRDTSRRSLWNLYRECDVFVHSGLELGKAWPIFLKHKKVVFIHHSCSFNWKQVRSFTDVPKWILSQFAHNICVSHAVKKHLHLLHGTVIHNAYDDNVFKLVNFSERRDFIYAGRLSHEKGCRVLIDAYADYVKNSKAPEQLTIVGEGWMKDEIASLIQGKGLSKFVRLTGSLSHEELQVELNKHKCLIIPSNCHEGFGLSAIEAMACGCFVVGSSGDGIREIIGDHGKVFPMGDSAALSREMLACDSLGQADFDQYIESVGPYVSRFSVDNMIEQYLLYFQKLSA